MAVGMIGIMPLNGGILFMLLVLLRPPGNVTCPSVNDNRLIATHASLRMLEYLHLSQQMQNLAHIVVRRLKPAPANPICFAQSLQGMLDEGEVRNQACLAERTGLTRSRITLASIPESLEMGKISRMAPRWNQESEDRGQNANKR
jgi:hypothetical protein